MHHGHSHFRSGPPTPFKIKIFDKKKNRLGTCFKTRFVNQRSDLGDKTGYRLILAINFTNRRHPV